MMLLVPGSLNAKTDLKICDNFCGLVSFWIRALDGLGFDVFSGLKNIWSSLKKKKKLEMMMS